MGGNGWRIVGGSRNERSFVVGGSFVDGRRRNKVGVDDVFDGENFYIFDGEILSFIPSVSELSLLVGDSSMTERMPKF